MAEAQTTRVPSATKARMGLGAVLCVTAALIGTGIFFLMRPAHFTNAGASGGSVAYTLPLETFIVNLGDGRSYLRVGVAIGLARAPGRKDDLPVALVRDTILSVLSTVKADQLTQAEGKSKLKAEILQALKDRAPQLGVEDVYFTEFLVQM
jgi:flagellar basal body-associated protein FliL